MTKCKVLKIVKTLNISNRIAVVTASLLTGLLVVSGLLLKGLLSHSRKFNVMGISSGYVVTEKLEMAMMGSVKS